MNVVKVKNFNDEGELRVKEIDENEAKLIEKVNSIKEEINLFIQKCRHLGGSFKHNGGFV